MGGEVAYALPVFGEQYAYYSDAVGEVDVNEQQHPAHQIGAEGWRRAVFHHYADAEQLLARRLSAVEIFP